MVKSETNLEFVGGRNDLPKWRQAVFDAARQAEFAEPQAWDIVSAVYEACSNAVQHSSGGRDHGVTLSIRTRGDRFEAVVTDRGGGFDPSRLPATAITDSIRGRGIPLMKRLMDEVRFDRRQGFRVTMVKYLNPRPT